MPISPSPLPSPIKSLAQRDPAQREEKESMSLAIDNLLIIYLTVTSAILILKMSLKSRAIIICLLLIIPTIAALADASKQEVPNVCPTIKSLLYRGEDSRSESEGLVHRRLGVTAIRTFIYVVGNPESLRSQGVHLRTVAGDLATADIPVGEVPRIASLPNVRYIRAARPVYPLAPMLDKSVPTTGADAVRKGKPSYTGKGVIVGIVDSGIDLNHPDFKHPDGTSRVLALWDQTTDSPGQSPRFFGYGNEWTKAQIDMGLATTKDVDGHGTHVASIAAGNGRGTGREQSAPRFVGVAPEADLVIVKVLLFDDTLADGVAYIIEVAKQLNKPAVINLSLGSQGDPHDGREAFDEILNRLLERNPRGNAIVAGAGNSGDELIHLGTTLPAPDAGRFPRIRMRSDLNRSFLVVEVWYEIRRGLNVRLLAPLDRSGKLQPIGRWVGSNDRIEATIQRGPLAGANVFIGSSAPDRFYRNLNSIFLVVDNSDNITIPLSEYEFGVEFDGPGVTLDAYVVSLGKFIESMDEDALRLIPDSESTIGSPASAADVIAVGSYTTKNEWLRFDGKRIARAESQVGEISAFSSIGPLRDGGRKPDVVAPGEFISAALSGDGLPQSFLENWIDQDRFQPDGTHIIQRGTSMATPHVTGAVALLLQQNPNLSFREIKKILIESAVDHGAHGWDEEWGYGQLNVLGMLGIPQPPAGVTVTPGNQRVEVRWKPNPESDISGYRVYYGGKVDDVGKKTQHRLVDLSNGVPIEITVTAYNPRNYESSPSFPLLAVPGDRPDDQTPPLAPKGLVGTLIDKQIHLVWSANREADLSHYELYVGPSPDGLKRTAEISGQTTHQVEAPEANRSIYLALKAVDASGNQSALSEIRSIPLQSDTTGPVFKNQTGWPLQVGHNIRGSAVLGDLTRDGFSEVILGTEDGKLYALDYKGVPLVGWPQRELEPIVSAPAIGDLDSDGRLEIVVGGGERLYVYAPDGNVKSGWPKEVGGLISADVTLVDLDADADMEIIATTSNGRVSVWHHNGVSAQGWPKTTRGEPLSSAAVGDLDGDGDIEIVLGGTSIYVWSHNGALMNRFGLRIPNTSAPVLADLDRDGDLEIIAGASRRLEIWHHNGRRLRGWPRPMNQDSNSTPAVGDIDGDGLLEIVMTADTTGLVYAWHTNGSPLDGWPVSTLDSITSSPLLADVNGDGTIEIILATNWEPNFGGMLFAWSGDGNTIDGWPIPTLGLLDATPFLGDLDSDGDIELVIASRRYYRRDKQTDEVKVFGGLVHAFDLPFAYDPENVEWGASHGNAAHTGRYDLPSPDVFSVFPSGKMLTQFGTVKVTALFQNYPNPFNPETWIPYQLATADANVRITIYNASGRQIRRLNLGAQPAGLYLAQDRAAYWDGRSQTGEPVSSAIYFYHLQTGSFQATRKMIILK